MKLIAAIFFHAFISFNGNEIISQDCSNHNVNKLIHYGNKIAEQKNTDSLVMYSELFFEQFPDNFNCFHLYYSLYDSSYNNQSTISKKHGVLYDYAFQHIAQIYNNLSVIETEKRIEMTIQISLGGYWEADAVSYFQFGLRNLLENNTDSFLRIINLLDQEDQRSFWFFYFDGPNPSSSTPKSFDKIKNNYPQMFEIILRSHQDVVAKWKD